MKLKNESKRKISESKLIYKSRCERNKKSLILYTILAILSDFAFIVLLGFFISFLIQMSFPKALLTIAWFLLGMTVNGLLGLIFTSLIILSFITNLYIFEDGIIMRLISIIPPEFKKIYISYEDITNVGIFKDEFGFEDLHIKVNDKEPYKLSQYHVDDLKKAKELILKKLNSKKTKE